MNANSSKTVKATDFKLDMRFQGQSGHDPLKIFREGGVCKNSLGIDMHSHECLLVLSFAEMRNTNGENVLQLKPDQARWIKCDCSTQMTTLSLVLIILYQIKGYC